MLDDQDGAPPDASANSQNEQLSNNNSTNNFTNPSSQQGSQNGSLQGSQQGSQPTSQLDDMLANDDDDDDLFTSNNNINNSTNSFNANQPTEPEQPSALIEWKAKKNEELAKLDAEEQQKNEEIRTQAKTTLDNYYVKLHDSQEKREKHNKEVDEQTVADQQNNDNKWEKTVSYIDFNRSDLHERDVSRMKSLLLQLKH